MKLRDEHKLKEKREWALDRPYVPYAVVLVIAVAVFLSYSYGVSSAANDAQEGAAMAAQGEPAQLVSKKTPVESHERKTWSYLDDLAGIQSWNRLTQWRDTPLLDMDPADREFVMMREDALEERRKEELRIQEAAQREVLMTAPIDGSHASPMGSDTEEVLPPEMASTDVSSSRSMGIRVPDSSAAMTGRTAAAPALTVPVAVPSPLPVAARTSTPESVEVRTPTRASAAARTSTAASTADTQAQPFAVQAKSFADEALAKEFADNLRMKIRSYPRKSFENGVPEVYVAQAVLKAGAPPWHRVRIGHFSTRPAANQFKLVMEQREGYEVWIVDR